MADPKVQDRLERFQIVQPSVDLSRPQHTSHGLFWYNLHLVLVHRERLVEINDDTLSRVRQMVLRASAAKEYLLSRGGILPDHVHLVLGCPFDVAPGDVAIGFLNNLSYVYGMKALFQYGGFLGTFGEYTNCGLKATRQLRTSFGNGQ
jgi:REP element-mobilizing transposase RayT